MSWPTIAECYDDIVKDPFLQQLFPEKEWTSIQELPLLDSSWFSIFSEKLFTHIASPAMWGKARIEFLTSNGQKISEGAIPMVILATDGVGEGNVGMVTTFCCHDQSMMEASNALSALHQCDSPEPSVVVVRKYISTPYIPLRVLLFPYLDMSTLSGDTSSAQFPLDWLHLHKIAPLLWHQGGLDLRRGRDGVESVSPFPRGSMAKLRRGALPLLPDFIVGPFIGPSPHQEEGIQMEGGFNFHPAFKLLQDVNQARTQLECVLVQQTQELAQRYDNRQITLSRRHERQRA